MSSLLRHSFEKLWSRTSCPLWFVSFVENACEIWFSCMSIACLISYLIFFSYANPQRSQKRHCYQLHWDTLLYTNLKGKEFDNTSSFRTRNWQGSSAAFSCLCTWRFKSPIVAFRAIFTFRGWGNPEIATGMSRKAVGVNTHFTRPFSSRPGSIPASLGAVFTR